MAVEFFDVERDERELLVIYDGEEGYGEIKAEIDLNNRDLISIVSFEVEYPKRGIGTKLFRMLRERYEFKYCESDLCLSNYDAFMAFYKRGLDVREAICYTPAWKIRERCGQTNYAVKFDEVKHELRILSEFSVG